MVFYSFLLAIVFYHCLKVCHYCYALLLYCCSFCGYTISDLRTQFRGNRVFNGFELFNAYSIALNSPHWYGWGRSPSPCRCGSS